MTKNNRMTSVSSVRLRYAREYYGLSIDQVSQKAKSIKPADLLRYEEGADFPTYSKLELLAHVYRRPMLYFFFKTQPQDEELITAFRSVEKEIGPHLDMQIRVMMEKASLYRLNIAELFGKQEQPKFTLKLEESNVKSDISLSAWLRDALALPLEKQKQYKKAEFLVEDLREKLFNIGIYVFKDSFRANDVSGICLYDELFPVILLNNKTSFTRQLFTIFHEIYHLYCKETDVYLPKLNEETACNRFAGEFLIPTADLQKRLEGVNSFHDMKLIESLADEYTVSRTAMAYRLKSCNKISPSFYLSVQDDGIRRMNTESSGGNFYYTRLSYLGKPYVKRVFSDYYAGIINISAVAKYTGLKTAHISTLSSFMFGGEY